MGFPNLMSIILCPEYSTFHLTCLELMKRLGFFSLFLIFQSHIKKKGFSDYSLYTLNLAVSASWVLACCWSDIHLQTVTSG